jgi:hypothetical protein
MATAGAAAAAAAAAGTKHTVQPSFTPSFAQRDLPVGVFVRVRPNLTEESDKDGVQYSHHSISGQFHDHFHFDFGGSVLSLSIGP